MKEMLVYHRRESKNSTEYDLADWVYEERLDGRKRNYRCISLDANSSFRQTMLRNFQNTLELKLDAEGFGRTVKDKEFVQTIW